MKPGMTGWSGHSHAHQSQKIVLILFTLFNDVRERRKEYTVFKKDELYLHDL